MRRVLCVLILVTLGNAAVQFPKGYKTNNDAYLQHDEAELDTKKEQSVSHDQGELKNIPLETGSENTKESHATSDFEESVGEKFDRNDAAEEIEDGENQNTGHRTRRGHGYFYGRGSHSSESFEHGNRYGGGFGGFGGYQNFYRPGYPQFGGYNYGQGYYNRHSSESFEG